MSDNLQEAGVTIAWPAPLDGGQIAKWNLSSIAGILSVEIEGVLTPKGPAIEMLGISGDSNGGAWPRSFRFHPWTGEELSAVETVAPASGRYGSASGLPIVETGAKSVLVGQPQPETLETGSFYFAIAGTPGFLHAIDFKSGEAFRKSRFNGQWARLGRYPRSGFPPWANALAATPKGIHYATADALIQIDCSFGAEPKVMPLGRVVGAPTIVGSILVVPHIADGTLRVALIEEDDPHPKHCTVSSTVPEINLLAAPIKGMGDVTYWLGDKGYLALEEQIGTYSATWHSWPGEYVGKPFLHPFRSKLGDLWSLGICKDEGLDRAAVCEIQPVLGTRTVHKLLGPHASAGNATYRQEGRHQPPWEPAIETLNFGIAMADRWPLPIASLASGHTVIALVEAASTMRAFLFREGPTVARSAKLYLHEPNGALHELGYACKLTSTDELDMFAFGDRLYLYHRNQNECVSWPLV